MQGDSPWVALMRNKMGCFRMLLLGPKLAAVGCVGKRLR